MLKIRLRRPGKSIKGRRHQKIVVTEHSWARESKFIDEIGYYDPGRELLKIDTDKYQEWVKKGAQVSETVASLFKNYQERKKTDVEMKGGSPDSKGRGQPSASPSGQGKEKAEEGQKSEGEAEQKREEEIKKSEKPEKDKESKEGSEKSENEAKGPQPEPSEAEEKGKDPEGSSQEEEKN